MKRRRWMIGLVGSALAGVVAASSLVSGSAQGTNLTKGWNNVSYGGGTMSAKQALASINGKYRAVYRWDSANQQYEMFSPDVPSFANSLDQLAAGDSIWLDVTAEDAHLQSATTNGGTGVLSIAASSFVPASDLALYEKTFNRLNPVGTDSASRRYYAPVQLPQGATITSMKAAFAAPPSGGDVQIRLDYTALTNADSDTGQVYKLAEALSSAGPSPMTVQAFAHTVDNAANVYFIVVDLTGGPATKLFGVSIAYTTGAN